MPDLVVIAGTDGERTITVAAERRFVIGRDEACNLVLDDTQVSRRHAYLLEVDGELEVGDLGSSNGTFVNGRRLAHPVILQPGDSLKIGGARLRLDGPSEDAVAEPPPPPPQKSLVRRVISKDSSVMQRLRLERSVRRATILAVLAIVVAVVAITAAATGFFSSDPPPEESPPTTRETIAEVAPSTVRILAKIGGVSVSSGTGWIYDADQGLIVTNAHVVGDLGSPGITSFRVVIDGHLRPAELYANSPCYDMAMLQVQDPAGLEALTLGSQASLAQGDLVNVVGYPSNELTNFSSTPLQSTTGTISVVESSLQSRSEAAAGDPDARLYPNLIQTDAAINHGNSGGPLVDVNADLVGINSLTTLETQGQGFAIGVDLFREQAPTLEQGDSIGFLGFDFVANGKGLVVNNAVEGTAAAEAGFGEETVVVTEVDRQPVATRKDFCRVVEDAEPGETATVAGVSRDGRFSIRLPFS